MCLATGIFIAVVGNEYMLVGLLGGGGGGGGGLL